MKYYRIWVGHDEWMDDVVNQVCEKHMLAIQNVCAENKEEFHSSRIGDAQEEDYCEECNQASA